MYDFGAIVLARFPFTDLSGDKRRPALVVSRDNARRADLVVCFITSVPRSGPDTAPIAPDPGTGLKVPSVVRFDKLATLDLGVIAGRLGAAPAAWLDAHRATFFGVFGFAPPAAPPGPGA
ncbi:type II toxin-antitoxin system PemK/MazF family toxin [Roseicella aerolata]|uniref:Type II toxin-antitoxin system PemK/MazF family toxin n=1 Tax=Roseicella aerolata TaxID=2883479 RepID=A0A9X1LA98_9PROT|nr:type II toxin-antitoxin system PemK/MazF family toxin [Roseicella aerolata]